MRLRHETTVERMEVGLLGEPTSVVSVTGETVTGSTIDALLRTAAEALSEVSTTPRLDAELLLARVLGWSRARVLAERRMPVADAEVAAFATLLARRQNLEPVAYLLGEREFYGLAFAVDARVLVPRPETELLVELSLQAAQQRGGALRIADIGTGSGAIAVTLAYYLPHAKIVAVDLSPDALAVAAQNVARHDVAARVDLRHGDLFAPLDGRFELIVSNPPYTLMAEIDEGVRRHEPHLALDGGPDGLDYYRRLIAHATDYLGDNGAILLEIGAWQGQDVVGLAHTYFPRAQVSLYRDLHDRDRVVVIDCRAEQ